MESGREKKIKRKDEQKERGAYGDIGVYKARNNSSGKLVAKQAGQNAEERLLKNKKEKRPRETNPRVGLRTRSRCYQ